VQIFFLGRLPEDIKHHRLETKWVEDPRLDTEAAVPDYRQAARANEALNATMIKSFLMILLVDTSAGKSNASAR
jgi:hypothetical protein